MGDWRLHARCRPVKDEAGVHYQTSRFYPEQGETAAIAKSLCKVCPVQKLCLADALLQRELFGIWGGTNRNERKPMLGILDAALLRVDLSHDSPALTVHRRDPDFTFIIDVA
jgi:WhiB family redox-sensing transcriptional regulator